MNNEGSHTMSGKYKIVYEAGTSKHDVVRYAVKVSAEALAAKIASLQSVGHVIYSVQQSL